MATTTRRRAGTLVTAAAAITAAVTAVSAPVHADPGHDTGKISASALGCQVGSVTGFARVRGGAAIPTFYTGASAAVDTKYNCSGGSVSVRRSGPGVYFVRFTGNGAMLAVVSANQDGASTAFSGDTDNIVSVGKITSGSDAGSFRVDVHDIDGSSTGHAPQDGRFTIILP